jgi:hypothetical protein
MVIHPSDGGRKLQNMKLHKDSRAALDLDYMILAILLGVFGIVGVTATATVSPNIFTSSTCNCVPSPLARVQELSVTLLAFSLVLVPIAMLRRAVTTTTTITSAPAAGTTAVPSATGGGQVGGHPDEDLTTGSRRVYTGSPMRSGELFAVGMFLVVFGIGLVVVPAFLVTGNPLLIGEGAAVIALGLFLAYQGGRSKG